jgi:hypothetical protein
MNGRLEEKRATGGEIATILPIAVLISVDLSKGARMHAPTAMASLLETISTETPMFRFLPRASQG